MRKEILYVKGIQDNISEKELSKSIEEIFLKSSNNLSWLSKGDKVLLKPALNSPDPYPSTTHPLAVKVISEILTKRGAEVIIADQSGIEHVLQDKNKILRGSSQDSFEKSGMKNSGVKFTAIEKRGWNSFYKFNSPSWKNGFYITDLVKKVDHIINLPRLSVHPQTGVSLGFKNWVGLLREDSRIEFHADGPFFNTIKLAARGSNLKKDYQNENLFFEKITEINLTIKQKLRLTLIVGTKAQVTLGPDKSLKNIPSYVVKPKTGIIFSSENPIATESLGIIFLTILYNQIPFHKKILQKILIKLNGKIKELGKETLGENPFIKEGLKINLGQKEFERKYLNVPEELEKEIELFLNS